MLKTYFMRLAPVACACILAVPIARAEEKKPSPPPSPTALATPFDKYQAWQDEPVQDWRQSNDRVGEVGGWRTYLRESFPDSSPAGHGHQGH